MNQFRAGQMERKLGISKRVFQIPPRHARMFSREDFGAHSLAILNGIYDAAVLICCDQVQLSCIAGNMLPLQERAGRSERERAGLLDSAPKHAAPRQIEERPMELRIE